MIKIKNIYLVAFIASSLLVGCGDDDNDYENETIDNNSTTGVTEGVATFSTNVMPILKEKCQRCHGSNGRFTITTTDATYANIKAFKSSMTEAGQYILDKGSNTIGHGGGRIISTSSAQYQTIQSWINEGAKKD